LLQKVWLQLAVRTIYNANFFPQKNAVASMGACL